METKWNLMKTFLMMMAMNSIINKYFSKIDHTKYSEIYLFNKNFNIFILLQQI